MNPASTYRENHSANPFVGLRAFDHGESHLFFGREEHIAEVRKKLEINHFVAVVGTSGTGKSSLIRAGVLPSIEAESTKDGLPDWNIVSMKPGNKPLENLAEVVAEKFQALDYDRTLALVKRSSLGLVQAMRGIMQPNERLLILVDQFEEVFRYTNDAGEEDMAPYTHFVNTLVDTMRQRDIPIYLILTLRSDFLGDCVRFFGLPEAINDGHYLVPRMAIEQIKRVITDPVAYADTRISPRTVQTLVNELGTDSDQLPILQHALMRTYDVWKEAGITSEPIDIKHLEATGGLHRALSIHADEAYLELNESQRALIARIFKALTVKAEGSRGVRRPLILSQLENITKASPDEIVSALRPFRMNGRSFVLPGLDVEASGDTIFDISHESLMRGWDRLKAWTEEEMESAALYIRICEAAELYKLGAAALWRDPELQLAEDWKERQQPNKAWGRLYHPSFEAGIDFLEKSRAQQEAELAAKKRRTRLVRAAVAVFVVVISGLSVWALYQSNIANEKSLEAEAMSVSALNEKARAEAEKEKALEASRLAEEAQSTAEAEAERAERQALIAAEQEQIAGIERQKAERAAVLARKEQEKALTQKELADIKTQEALLQKQKADSARDQASRLRMIALSENLAYQSAQITSNPELAALLAIESYQLAKTNGGKTNSPSLYAASQKALQNLDLAYTPVKLSLTSIPLVMTANKSGLAIISSSGDFETVDLDSYDLVSSTPVLPKGAELNSAFILNENPAWLLGLNSFQISTSTNATLDGHLGLLRGAAMTPEGDRYLTGARDGLIKLWEEDAEIHSADLGSRIRHIARLGNSKSFLISTESGTTYEFNDSDMKLSSFAQREGVRAEVVTTTEHGKRIAVGYSDGLVELYSPNGEKIAELPHLGSIRFLQVDAQDDILIVGTTAKAVYLYSLNTPTDLPIEIRETRPIEALTYIRDMKTILLATSDKYLKAYTVRNSAWIEQLESLVSRSLTQAERETYINKE